MSAWRGCLLSLVALALAACGGLGGEPEIAATAPSPGAQAIVPETDSRWKADIKQGAAIFAEHCVECHGIGGDGRGNLVAAGSVERPLDMTNRSLVAAKSPLEWFEIITTGRIEDLMPPWENALSERERWDVALYSYTLAYDDELLASGERVWREGCGECELPAVIPPVFSDVDYGAKLNRELFRRALTDAEAEAAAAYARFASLSAAENGERLSAGALKGRVLPGTAGSLLPEQTLLQLRYGNNEVGFSFAETTADADGNFQFNEIPLTGEFDYVIGAVYGERFFSRRVFPGEEPAPTIRVYDATHDPLVVSVARIEIFIEPVTLQDLGAGLYISQILTYRNSSDRVYTSGRGFDDGRQASLLIQFPLGARFLSDAADGRYVVVEGIERLPDSAIDTQPVLPGETHQVIHEYWLPYAGAAKFEQTFNNLIDAAVTVTLPERLLLDSDWLLLTDEASAEGYKTYGADLKLERDPALRFGISGDPTATSSDDGLVVTSETLPALLLGAVAVGGGLLGGIGLLRRRKDLPGSEIERLVGELARLEEAHDQGRINHDLYHHRRRELKAKLTQLMADSDE